MCEQQRVSPAAEERTIHLLASDNVPDSEGTKLVHSIEKIITQLS